MRAPPRCLRRAILIVVPLLAAAGVDAAEPAIAVPPGFEATLVAGAPLVKFPMLGGFDDRGRLFLAENAGVNLDEKALAEQRPSRITRLEDTDGDGVFDRSVVFADQLAFPQGALWHDGALYVTSAPSVWRLEDRDGDGRADVRTEIATGFKSTGNAADVHGPFLHPNGRLYWCHGRKGHTVYQNNGGALVSSGLGARIWSCRPDGSDIQVHAGGGMDNPVEVTFNQEGEMFGTVNLFHGSPRSDAIVHWVHGGVYPRADQEPVLAEFPRTGELLPPVTLIGHVAPAGIVLPRSDTWGAAYRNNLFYAEFNTRRIMRVPLERSGATYRGHAEVFATATDPGVHFTDVIEDADGSLLLVNTGAWFRRGCPTSIVSRADITGGIYRLRRTGVAAMPDSRGNAIDWPASPVAALVEWLGDTRPVVRDRAVAELVRRGDATTAALAAALDHKTALVRSNAVWALIRIASPAARAGVRTAMRSLDARVREAACQGGFVLQDAEAAETLVARLGDDALPVQREAARALGRLRNPQAIPALGGAAALPRDPVLTHALIHALIEINAPKETQSLLRHREPLARRAALIAFDRIAGASLAPEPVFTALRDPNTELRDAALQIAVRHTEWGRAAAEFLAGTPADSRDRPTREITRRLLAAFLPSVEVRDWLRAKSAALDPQLVLDAIAHAPQAWDEGWRDLLVKSLRSPDTERAQAALRAMTTHRARNFTAVLQETGRDASRPTVLRVAALQLAAGAESALDGTSFDLLLAALTGAGNPTGRLQAANVFAGARLTRAQLLRLADALPAAGPVELQQLFGAFQRGPAEADVGARLLAQLAISPGRWGLSPASLHGAFQRYPAPAHENAGPLIAEIANQSVARDSRVAELESLATTGDAARGRTAFLAGAGACLSCHRVDDMGSALGPDLSHIGRIRTTRDLVEAIAFPSASIARGYEAFQVSAKDGRTLTGTLSRETADTLFVLTPDGHEHALPRADVAKLEPVTTSLMPPGLDRALEPQTLADLVAFLKSRP